VLSRNHHTAPPALALPKVYQALALPKVWRLLDRIYTSFVRVPLLCVCQPVVRSVDSSRRIKLSFIQVFESNVQNVHYYSVNIIEVYFQSFLILISVSLELSFHKLSLFYSSCLIW